MNTAGNYQQQRPAGSVPATSSLRRNPPARPLNPGTFSPTNYTDPVANVPYGSPIHYQSFSNRRTTSGSAPGLSPGFSQARSRAIPSLQRQGSSPPQTEFGRPSLPRSDMFTDAPQSPVPHHPYFAPPPPFMHQQQHHHTPHRGAPNVFDQEPMVAEHDVLNHRLSPISNSPLAVPGPNCHYRDPSGGNYMYRASSAVGDGYHSHTARQLLPATQQAGHQQHLHQHHAPHRAASTAPAQQLGKIQYTNNCNQLIEERDPATDRVVARYRCGALLGTGGFAKVFDVIDINTGARYACKIIDKVKLSDSKKRMKFFAEVDIHSRLNHPNILHFHKTFQDEWYHYMLLERCGKESLMELSKARTTFSTDEIQHIMVQLLSAVEYLHSKHILHRDLKLGNVMVDAGGNMKIGDFGFATQLSGVDERKFTMCGTPNYIAPEVLSSRPNTSTGYSYEVDIWSLGVILYTLAVGTPPFETKDLETTYRRIQFCEYGYPQRCNASESLRSLVSVMLQLRPESRWSLVQIRGHRFFRYPPCPTTAPLSLVGLDADISPPESRNGSPFLQNYTSSPFAQVPSPGLVAYSARRADEVPTPNLAVPSPAPRVFDRVLPVGGAAQQLSGRACSSLEESPSSSSSSSTVRVSSSHAAVLQHSPEASAPSRPPQPLPPAPSVIITCFVTFPKYGHGFLLQKQGTCEQRVAGLLNDRSKIVYDSIEDKVWYYARVKGGTSPINDDDDRGRSPSVPGPASGAFYDERHDFSTASVTLSISGVRIVHSPSPTNVGAVSNDIVPSALKKFTIVKFLQMYMSGQRAEVCTEENPIFKPGFDSTTISPNIFASAQLSTPDGKTLGGSVRRQLVLDDVVYVKSIHMCPLSDLKFRELRNCESVQSAAARFSDGSFQLSLRALDGAPFLPLLAPLLISAGSPSGEIQMNAWSSFDFVWYPGEKKHVLILLKDSAATVTLSLFDATAQIATDSSRRATVTPSSLVSESRGVSFTAAGTTQLVLPPLLTKSISDLLQNVQAPASMCFC